MDLDYNTDDTECYILDSDATEYYSHDSDATEYYGHESDASIVSPPRPVRKDVWGPLRLEREAQFHDVKACF